MRHTGGRHEILPREIQFRFMEDRREAVRHCVAFRSMVKQNSQWSAVEYSGQISSSEAIQRGAHIVCDDQGIMTAYAVEPLTGMSGIRQYLLKEEGVI